MFYYSILQGGGSGYKKRAASVISVQGKRVKVVVILLCVR